MISSIAHGSCANANFFGLKDLHDLEFAVIALTMTAHEARKSLDRASTQNLPEKIDEQISQLKDYQNQINTLKIGCTRHYVSKEKAEEIRQFMVCIIPKLKQHDDTLVMLYLNNHFLTEYEHNTQPE
jgi:hypothetical protein